MDATDTQLTHHNIELQYNEGRVPFHTDLNLAGAHSIKIRIDPGRIRTGNGNHSGRLKHIKDSRTASSAARAIRAMTRSQQRQYDEEDTPDILMGDDKDENDSGEPFTSNNTDEITHPQYRDVIVQKALAQR